MRIVDHCPLCGSPSIREGHDALYYEPVLDDWIRRGFVTCNSCGARIPVVYDGENNPKPAWRLNARFDDAMRQVDGKLKHLKRQATDSPNGFVDAEVVEGVCMRIEEILKPWRCDDEAEGKG